jgi:hypothetical protein
MTVRSFPPGAQVFVDDQEIGTTPCSASYVYYGTRKLTIVKDGYRTETLYQKFSAPWYEYPPLDFVSENLLPNEIRDERVVEVQLVPEEIVPQAKLVERAQLLRDSARTGQITPLVISGQSPPQPVNMGIPGQGLPGGAPIPRYPLPAPGPNTTLLPPQSSANDGILPLPAP